MSPSLDMREKREFASEVKFLINPQVAELIRDWARARLAPDPHAGGPSGDIYQITSLYFDTEQWDVFYRRGSYGRSKLRIRRYDQSAVVFLERKLRTHGLLAKRRSVVKVDELERLAGSDLDHGWPGRWFHRRLQARRLGPVCQITYQRTARVAMTPYGPIRLTLDENLRVRSAGNIGFCDEAGNLILEDKTVLELKFRYEMPVLFKNLVTEFVLTPQAFSKYRLAAAALGVTGVPVQPTQDHPVLQYA
jgi:hypothetical protein